jgi:FlaA1/EpsC-like NDP-sugar epimerase
MDRRTPLAAGLDTFAVVLFVAIGRREHERDSAIVGLIETAAPFLIALALAWLVLRVWKRPTEWQTGVGVLAIVVVVGMLLRNLVFGDGTATAFVIVATLFLALFIVGWRLAFAVIDRRRSVTPGV